MSEGTGPKKILGKEARMRKLFKTERFWSGVLWVAVGVFVAWYCLSHPELMDVVKL
jgi:hypothetical protein